MKCVSLTNRICQIRPTFFNINSDETLFYSVTVSGTKSGGSCNTIDDPYARICVMTHASANLD